MVNRSSASLIFLIVVLAFSAGQSTAFCQAFAPSQDFAPDIFARKPPAAPGLSFSFTAGPTGMAYALFYFTQPGGQTITVGYSSIDAPTSGSFRILSLGMSLNEYQQAGVYKPTADEVGNSTDYTEAQLASVFPTQALRVINPGASDGTPPKVLSGKIVLDESNALRG